MRPLVVAFWFASVFTLSAQAPESILREALAAHQQGDLTAAADGYREFLKVQPNALPARANLGAVYARQGRYREATAEYLQALQQDPSNPGLLLNLGLAYYKQAQLGDAIVALQRIAPERRSEQVILLLADCYLRLGEEQKVVALLQPVYARKPDNSAVEYLLGTALIRTGHAEEGARVVDKIFARGDTAEAHLLLATMQMAGTENKKAVEHLQIALQKSPDLPGVYSLYGQAKLNDGDSAAAKDAFREALKRDPNDYEANLQLGALLRIEKEFDEAETYLRRAEQIRPLSVALQYQLGSLALGQGKVDQARAVLEGVTKSAPEFVEGHITLATVYYRLKRKADGDKERKLVDELTVAAQKKELERGK